MRVDPEIPTPSDRLGKILAIIGFALNLVVGVIFFAAAGLVAPLGGIIFLAVCWFGLLFVAIRLWNRAPRLIVFLPLASFAVWFVVVTIGDRVLGWRP